MKKILFSALFLFLINPLLSADALSGQIEKIQDLSRDQKVVTVKTQKGSEEVMVTDQTSVQAFIPASRIKKGSSLLIDVAPAARKPKAFHSPFKGMSKSMRRRLGIPDVPDADIPEMPPAKADLPEVPKSPVKAKSKKTAALDIPEASSGKSAAKNSKPPENREPSPEEKSLYGRAEQMKPLQPVTKTNLQKGKVLSIETTKNGIKLQLEIPGGKTKEIVLSPENSVIESVSSQDLQQNMRITADTLEQGKRLVAEKIIVES